MVDARGIQYEPYTLEAFMRRSLTLEIVERRLPGVGEVVLKVKRVLMGAPRYV